MRELRIDILAIDYPPEPTGAAERNRDLAEALANAGHSVRVITGMPHRPGHRKHGPYRWRLGATEKRGIVTVIRCYTFVPHGESRFGEWAYRSSYGVFLFFRLFFSKRPDVVMAVSPPGATGIVAWLFRFLRRRPYFLDVRELPAEWGVAGEEEPPLRRSHSARLLEQEVFRWASRIGCAGLKMRHRLAAKGVAETKIHILRNWTDPEKDKETEETELDVELGTAGACLVAAFVNDDSGSSALDFAAAAERLRKEKELVFLLVGSGPAADEADGLITGLGLIAVRRLPHQRPAGLAAVLKRADLCVFEEKPGAPGLALAFECVSALAAGKPCIFAANASGEGDKLARDLGLAVLVPPGRPEELAQAIAALATSPAQRLEISEAAMAFAAENLTREKVVPALAALLDDVAND